MICLSKCVAFGATLGMIVGCGSSSPQASGGAGTTSSSAGATSNAGGPNSAGGDATSSAGTGSGGADTGPGPTGSSTASSVVAKLGRKGNFLIGMGSDYDAGGDHSKDGAYLLGPTLDLHYGYLVGLMGKGGWPDWNANGGFVDILADSADMKGVTPMYTLYSMAADGDGNLAGLSDNGYMKPYFDGLKLLYQRLAAFGKPAVVHFEPDFWAYAELQSKDAPASMKVNVSANAPDCVGLSDDLIGLGHCMVKLARMYAPKALVGFHASSWSSGDPATTVAFLKAVGADQADLVFTDMLDRDAGCFEAGTDPNCKRTGNFYWDETNQQSPNFHENFSWVKAVSSGLGLPMMWWQVPFGAPSATKGGAAGHYRDNRVHYMFSHMQELIDAGGVGAAFGAGADNQTTPSSDGGQFKAAVTGYFAKPAALP